MDSIQYQRSLQTTANSASSPSLSTASAVASASASASAVASASGITSWSWTTWLIIVMALAFLGINVFSVLGKGTERIANIFKPIVSVFEKLLKLLGFSALETVDQTVNASATGVTTVANIVSADTTQAVDKITGTSTISSTAASATGTPQQEMQGSGSQIDFGQQNKNQNQNANQMADGRNNTLQDALNDAESHMTEQNNLNASNDGIVPDDSYSSIQTGGKSGWCYIGEERGTRSCVQVGVNDECMSGDVFPTNDVCVNPNLRA